MEYRPSLIYSRSARLPPQVSDERIGRVREFIQMAEKTNLNGQPEVVLNEARKALSLMKVVREYVQAAGMEHVEILHVAQELSRSDGNMKTSVGITASLLKVTPWPELTERFSTLACNETGGKKRRNSLIEIFGATEADGASESAADASGSAAQAQAIATWDAAIDFLKTWKPKTRKMWTEPLSTKMLQFIKKALERAFDKDDMAAMETLQQQLARAHGCFDDGEVDALGKKLASKIRAVKEASQRQEILDLASQVLNASDDDSLRAVALDIVAKTKSFKRADTSDTIEEVDDKSRFSSCARVLLQASAACSTHMAQSGYGTM